MSDGRQPDDDAKLNASRQSGVRRVFGVRQRLCQSVIAFRCGPPANVPTVAINRGPLYDLQQQFGLVSPNVYDDAHGQQEKYFHSSNGSNPAGGGYYVLMPNNLLYASGRQEPAHDDRRDTCGEFEH